MNRVDKILDEAFQSPLLGNITDQTTRDQMVRLIRAKGGNITSGIQGPIDRHVIEFNLGPKRYRVTRILQGPGSEKGWQIEGPF